MLWSKDRIIYELGRNDRLVERAILAIYRRQTEDEKATKKTKYRNGQGFSGPDARVGTYLARWLLDGKRLSGDWLVKGRKLAVKYSGQLEEVAKERNYAKTG